MLSIFAGRASAMTVPGVMYSNVMLISVVKYPRCKCDEMNEAGKQIVKSTQSAIPYKNCIVVSILECDTLQIGCLLRMEIPL